MWHEPFHNRHRAASSRPSACLPRAARGLRRNQAGAVIVEFALLAPIVLLMLFAMIDFGKAYSYWIDQTHLANEGARWAAVNHWPSAETLPNYILQQANSTELGSGGGSSVPSPAQVYVCFPNGTGSTVGDPVVVTVRSQYNFVPLVGENLKLTTKAIQASSTMRLEADPTYDANSTYDATDNQCQPQP